MRESDLESETRERLDEWERVLRYAVEHTHVEHERRRIQRELVEISTRRDQLSQLDESQLTRLHRHLGRDPQAWVRHERF